ncbi:universal stress protein [Rhodocaloribacter sp.]
MITRILLPTDFSETAGKALDFVLGMKPCGVEEVALIHVIDVRIIAYTDVMFEETVDEERLVRECEETCLPRLKSIEERLKAAGFRTRTLTPVGVPFAEINEAAEEVDASLVVLGHRGTNLAEELLLGSTAEKVARKCKRPVLLVR